MTHPLLWLRPETVLKTWIFPPIDILANFFPVTALTDNEKTIYSIDCFYKSHESGCTPATETCLSPSRCSARLRIAKTWREAAVPLSGCKPTWIFSVQARRWQRSRDGGGMERGGRDERCGVKKGMRGVKAIEGKAIKSDGGRGPWMGWGSALCVAMVQAQSELLHSSVLLLS